jgi:hypothetical protein
MMAQAINGLISKFKPDNNQALITDIISKLTITLGIIFIVGGFYLMAANPSSQQVGYGNSAQSSFSIDWVPGVPLFAGDLTNLNAVLAGSVIWILGVNLLLVGLGLWVRHQLARLAAILIFSLAALFQFIQLLFLGVVGSPVSAVLLLVNAAFSYFLLSHFDAKTACATK